MNLPIETASPVDHASIEAGDAIGCVLTLAGGEYAWTGPFAVVANDRDAEIIAVRDERGSLETFVAEDELIRWTDALDGAARAEGRICACDGPHRAGCTAV